jgi:hypothetical protein
LNFGSLVATHLIPLHLQVQPLDLTAKLKRDEVVSVGNGLQPNHASRLMGHGLGAAVNGGRTERDEE